MPNDIDVGQQSGAVSAPARSSRKPDLPQDAGNFDKGKFRGPLRYEIETSSTVLEAGSLFSVFLRITNPYDVPVTIFNVETQLPVEFLEPYSNRPKRGTWQQTKDLFSREYKDALEQGTQRVRAHSLSVKPITNASEEDRQNPNPGEKSEELGEVEEPDYLAGVAQADVLEPGNSILKEFTVRTRERNLFTPSVYFFHMQITYGMEGKTNHDTAKTSLNIKAPISAMALGAVLGAAIGTFLKYFEDSNASLPISQLLVSLSASVLIGLVLVVAFARKKDAQPFITIEDFYGGAFVGVLAGYSGYSLLHQVVSG